MSKHLQLVEQLRQNGHRVTPQRVMILDVMQAQGGHITADEIYQRVHAAHPYVNRSTVYRTLDMLAREGIITVTDLGKGCVHYELHSEEPHHHLVCQTCGHVAILDHALLEPLQNALQRKYKFSAQIEHFAIFGKCAKCQAQPVRRKPR